MRSAFLFVRQAVIDAAHHLRPVGLFLVGWSLVYAVVLAPATTWALRRLIAHGGNRAVSNEDIVAFLWSPSGSLFLVLAGTLNLAFLYAQQAGLFVIGSADPSGPTPGLLALLWQTFHRIPALVRLALLQLAGFIGLLLPFAAIVGVVAWSVLGEHDINFYLATRPSPWIWTVRLTIIVLGGYALAAAWLLLRWLLAVPYLIRSGERPHQCLRQSWRTTRGRMSLVATPVLLWWAGWIVITLTLGGLFVAAAKAVIGWGLTNAWSLGPMLVALQGLALVGGVLGTFVGGVVHQFLVAKIFWNLHPPALALPAVPARPPLRLFRPVAAAFVLALTFSVVSTGWQARSLKPAVEVAITAHRGSSRQAPENTLSAIRQAIADGADYAEIDVQSTKDGEVVVLHDGDLMRLAHDPRKVEELTLAELKQIDVGSWFGAGFKDERPATLQEVIAVARGRIKLNVELKYNRPDSELAGRVLAILRTEDFIGECVVTSLAAEEVMRLKQLAPDVQVGVIITAALGDYTRLPVDLLSLNAGRADVGTVAAARRQGKAVHVWTINETEAALRMIAFGANNLITDVPADLARLRLRVRELNRAQLLALWWSARFIL